MTDNKETNHKYHTWYIKTLQDKVEDINITSNKYDKIRKITEFLYIFQEYLPIVFVNNKSYHNLTISFYNALPKMYDDIYNELLFLKNNIDNNNNEKKRIVNILLEEMRNVEDILIPLLPETYTSTHLVKCVTEDPMKLRKSKNHILFVYENE